jgi:hypothetical protein
MNLMFRTFPSLLVLGALFTPFQFLLEPANASLSFDIFESGDSLIVETSGSLTLPASIGSDQCFFDGLVIVKPDAYCVCTGPKDPMYMYDLSGPNIFKAGAAFLAPASSVEGLATAIFATPLKLGIDQNYVSASPFLSTAIFENTSLAEIGLTPATGSLGTWTLSNGETINLNVRGPVNETPGPLPLFGAAAAFGFSRRLRQRIQLSKTPAKG